MDSVRTGRVVVLLALVLAHGVVTAVAMQHVGYVGIFELGLANWGARQVFSDLTVSLLLINGWILLDARRNGRQPWAFVVASLPLGSFAPLGYLLWREVTRSHAASPTPLNAGAQATAAPWSGTAATREA